MEIQCQFELANVVYTTEEKQFPNINFLFLITRIALRGTTVRRFRLQAPENGTTHSASCSLARTSSNAISNILSILLMAPTFERYSLHNVTFHTFACCHVLGDSLVCDHQLTTS